MPDENKYEAWGGKKPSIMDVIHEAFDTGVECILNMEPEDREDPDMVVEVTEKALEGLLADIPEEYRDDE